jgi:hypothetical protein
MKYFRVDSISKKVVELFSFDPQEYIPNLDFLKWCFQVDDDVEVLEGDHLSKFGLAGATLNDFKQQYFVSILNSAEHALKSFEYQGLTFEMSGESKANLFAVIQAMQVDPNYSTPWLALNGTYKLGEQNLLIISSSNINEFKQAFEQKTGAVFQWQLTTQEMLEQATTIEEVEAISTEFNG